MAIVFVNRVQGGSTASTNSVASPTMNASAGNLLVALVTWTTGVNFSSISDTAGNTWTQAGVQFSGPGTVNVLILYYAYNCLGNASNVVTVNLSGNTSYRSIVVEQFSGVQINSDPLEDNVTNTVNGVTTFTSTNLNATAQNVLVGILIDSVFTKTGTNSTNVTNFAITGDANTYFADMYKIVSSSDALTGNIGGSSNYDIKSASFKAAPIGGFNIAFV